MKALKYIGAFFVAFLQIELVGLTLGTVYFLMMDGEHADLDMLPLYYIVGLMLTCIPTAVYTVLLIMTVVLMRRLRKGLLLTYLSSALVTVVTFAAGLQIVGRGFAFGNDTEGWPVLLGICIVSGLVATGLVQRIVRPGRSDVAAPPAQAAGGAEDE